MSDEFDFIRFVKSQTHADGGVIVPAGDDMAVVDWNGREQILLAVDQVLDGVHFRSEQHDPRSIGHKVMNRNLSDCAAMGCEPVYALLCLALEKSGSDRTAQQIFLGAKEAGEPFGCRIIGGETGAWHGKTAVSVTIIGRSGGVRPVLRTGAKPGHSVFVTGPLGGSILGRHMTFEPRVKWGRTLAKCPQVTAMTDISDGLSRDLANICEASGVGAVIESDEIPIHADVFKLTDRREPIEHALHDGEDYELLVTMDTAAPNATLKDVPLIRIGTISKEPGLRLRNDNGEESVIQMRGWEHSL